MSMVCVLMLLLEGGRDASADRDASGKEEMAFRDQLSLDIRYHP